MQQTLTDAVATLKLHLQQFGCKYLNAGCFAAGTPLWTPDGYRRIETLVPGELVYSRDEYNPAAPVEAKVIEEVFTRYAGVYHLHIGGQVIGTSGEHSFYVAGRGWTAANELQVGDGVLCADGTTVRVEEVFDTGEWEVVYNLRVADHHTYFVGEESWGWCAWAHNAYYYHGTTKAYANSIIANGASVDTAGLKKDFGKGFYTTTDKQQAIDWARKNPGGGSVVVFSMPTTVFETLTVHSFGSAATDEWKAAVWQGRRGSLDITPLPYDVAEGPMLKNWRDMKDDPASANLAIAFGQQTVWLSTAALISLNKQTRFLLGPNQ